MEAPVVATDTWVQAGWETFVLLSGDPIVDAMNGRVNMSGRAANSQELVSVSTSGVLDGLTATALEEALQLGWSEGDTAAMQYILGLPRDIEK